jgi:4-hydroxy-tetrahydrodipicolinate reductase
MSQPRIVIYGVGAMGSLISRMILEKGGEIVGAIGRSPEKVGRDLGAVAELGRETGIVLSDDADRVLAETSPDIVVLTVASYMDDNADHVRRCVKAGANVITLSEELLCSWDTSPAETAALDALAREHGVTISATGHQDGYWVSLIGAFMGTAHAIDEVRGQASWNVDDFGPELARDQQVGTTAEEFEAWNASGLERPPTFGRTSLHALARLSGLTIASSTTTTRPAIADAALHCSALDMTVEAGNVIGFTDIDSVETVEGITLVLEMTGKVYAPGEADHNTWTITGEPTLTLVNDTLPTHLTTCSTLVNRIPDVIAAPPGYCTPDQLPMLRHRARDLAS